MVKDNEGRDRIVYTFISGDGNFAYKLRHFCQTLDMIEDYEDGIFNIMRTIGKFGKAFVIIKKGTSKADGSGEVWPDRNDIKDFIFEDKNLFKVHSHVPETVLNKTESSLNQLDDDVPF